jgi:polyhydroxyalkanoate synthesis regulator phasin
MAKRTRSAEAAETLRGAVDRTYQATVGQAQVTRDRAQDLVDELTNAAGRVRGALDDLRLASAEDLRLLRRRVSALERRVAELEGKKKPARKPAKRTKKA